jgi:phosphoribosylformylglycinamidine synthase
VVIGRTGGTHLSVKGERIQLDDLRAAHEGWLPSYMAVA